MSDVRFFLKKAADGNEIEVKGDLSVGRSLESGLKLTEGNPSRNHARFTMLEGALYVEDLKSTNGTFVNGARIDRKMRLAPNDKIRFDLEEYVLRVEVPAPPKVDAEQTAMRPAGNSAVAEAAKPNVPPAWADGGAEAGGNKTVFKSVEQMEEERKRARAEEAGQLGPASAVSYLHSGDRIAFGPAECVFQAPESSRESAQAVAGSGASAPVNARRKRGLLIAALSFLGTLLLIVVLLKWLG